MQPEMLTENVSLETVSLRNNIQLLQEYEDLVDRESDSLEQLEATSSREEIDSMHNDLINSSMNIDTLKDCLKTQNSFAIVLRTESGILQGITMVKLNDDMKVEETYVMIANSLKGKGFGKQLIVSSISALKKRGVKEFLMSAHDKSLKVYQNLSDIDVKLVEPHPTMFKETGKGMYRVYIK